MCDYGDVFSLSIFFFNDTATTEIYTLSLHDALPICPSSRARWFAPVRSPCCSWRTRPVATRSCWPCPRPRRRLRSEEHTSELQSRQYLVCRLLLEKKKKTYHR